MPYLSAWSRSYIVIPIVGVLLYFLVRTGLSLGIPTRRDIRYTPKSDFGLVLSDHFNPQAAGPGVDIIFVHGLGSNPDTTWSAQNKSYICERSNRIGDDQCGRVAGKERVNWVTDFFHDDIPLDLRTKTRAFFYNYDSYWMRDAIEEQRETLGKELFEQVVSIAAKDPERMFMFIGHSYGGLVIKEAFISAFEYQEHRPVNIVQQTRAIIFMGTPHRGSDESKFGLFIARILGFFRLQSNPDILRPMEYDSPELGEMHQRFEAISQSVMGADFYEARKFRSFLGLRWTYVVKPASAKMDRPKWENIPLLTDHTEIILQVEHSATSVYEVPLRSKKQYVERNELSANLERSLSTRSSIVAIVGLGGMGKTQLALRYAESHRSRYNVILWIDVTSEETLLSSFRQCAQALDIFPDYPNASESLGITDIVRIVLRWLQQRDDRHGETLLIYDNMDEFSTRIENFLPSSLHGSIIVTTRNVQSLAMFPEGTHLVNVADMTSPEAQMLLLRYLDLNATES
ncbi:hypothetical protein ABKA04_001582 [Annulohypoxylon sp. FPYF3050]